MRYPFLALLAEQPRYGHELKVALDERFGEVLPSLNAGQVYTTLQRLERDGLVEGDAVAAERRPTRRVYRLTTAGRAALAEWVATPARSSHVRDEFFLKLVLAGLGGIGDPQAMIEAQRREYLQALRTLEAYLAGAQPNGNVPALLLAEGASLRLQADLQWLDLCQQRVREGMTDGTPARG